MSTSICLRLSSIALLAALPSCGLVKAPFRVAGAVVDGTAYVGKKAYDASAAPFKKTPEEKAQEEKEKKKEADKAAKQPQAPPEPQGTTPAPAPPPLPQAEGQVPTDDYLPPPPDDIPPPP